jgi:hypothetical protein
MARARWLGREVDFAPARADYAARNALVAGLLEAAVAHEEAEVVDLAAVLCDDRRCPVERDGAPLYHDSNHLRAGFAPELAPLVAPVIAGR